jgi:hypothetical protein
VAAQFPGPLALSVPLISRLSIPVSPHLKQRKHLPPPMFRWDLAKNGNPRPIPLFSVPSSASCSKSAQLSRAHSPLIRFVRVNPWPIPFFVAQ